MFLKQLKEVSHTTRTSKLGKKHVCKRTRTLYLFICDVCDNQFTRPKGQIQEKRVSNYYKHVCNSCDPKRFAQKKGVEKRKTLDSTIDTLVTIDTL